MLRLLRWIAVRFYKRHPLLGTLTTLGIAIGVALFSAIHMIQRSTSHSFDQSIEAIVGKAALTVRGGESGFSDKTVSLLEKLPQVQAAVPMIEVRAFFAGKKIKESLMVFGVDLLKESAVRDYQAEEGEEILEDPLEFLNQPDSIIITRAFSKKHHFKVEDTITFATPYGKKTFHIRGILKPKGIAQAYGGALAVMDIDGAAWTFGKQGKVDRIDIVLKKGAIVSEVKKEISQRLGPAFEVLRPEGQSQQMKSMIASFEHLLSFDSLLGLLVSFFLVFNAVSMGMAQRRKEMGLLRAVGATRKHVFFLFLLEAMSLGAFGACLGLILGYALAHVLVKAVTFSMTAQYLTLIEIPHLVFQASDVFLGIFLGVFSAFLGALFPVYQSVQVEPLDAIREQTFSFQEKMTQIPFLKLFGVGLVMALYVCVSSWLRLSVIGSFFEFFELTMSVFATVFLAPLFVWFCVKTGKNFFSKRKTPLLRLAHQNLLRAPKLFATNTMGLVVGLMLVTWIATLHSSFQQSISKWFRRYLHPDLVVSSHGRLIAYQVQPLHESLGKKVAQIPGVISLHGSVFGLRFIHLRYQNKRIALKAFDEPISAEESPIDVLDGSREKAVDELFHHADTVMVSQNFAFHFKKKRGDFVFLKTPTGVRKFRIVGTVIDYADAIGVVYLSRKLYKKYWQDPLVSVFGIKIKHGFSHQKVRDQIITKFGERYNLMVTFNQALRKEMLGIVDQSFSFDRAILWTALLIALLSIFNTLFVSVLERTRELGLLRAIGMRGREMRRMVLFEALLQGTYGAVFSALCGVFWSFLWIRSSLTVMLGWMIHFHMSWVGVFGTVGCGIVVAWIGALYPALRAQRLSITKALSYE